MVEFWAAPSSPWSEKARWALDFCGCHYVERAYRPLLDEPALRVRLRRWTGPVTVPALFAKGMVPLMSSYDIGVWASAQAPARGLVPAGHEKAIHACNVLADRGMEAGRALAFARMLEDREALEELLPPRVPKAAVALARLGVQRTQIKYRANNVDLDYQRRLLERFLLELRNRLANQGALDGAGEPRLLFETFSLADVAMAQMLAFVVPPARGLTLGPALRRAYTTPELAADFADLVTWRDLLYARYR